MSGNSDFKLDRRVPKPFQVPGSGKLCVDFDTSMGRISCRLLESRTPVTVWNFAEVLCGKLIGKPYLDGLTFHRVVPEFLIHGGCPNGDGTGGPGHSVPHEEDVTNHHDRGGLLTQFYVNRDTGGSQFMITEEPAPWLDRNHTIFGEVVEGMDVVKKIARVPSDKKNRPLKPIVIEKAVLYRGRRQEEC